MPQISRAFRADRNEPLHRVLRALPGDFLVALIEGLERADRIVAGRLFAGKSGGCVVGVTLRMIEPEFRGRRMIWGRWARRGADGREVAKAVALWVAAEARTELLLREMTAAWLDPLTAELSPAREPAGRALRVPAPA
jgi:hypothetical protein